jgi:hypothetical protein
MRPQSGSATSDESGHADDRAERSPEPQYQRESDRVAAQAMLDGARSID